jgi:hypothetical protein
VTARKPRERGDQRADQDQPIQSRQRPTSRRVDRWLGWLVVNMERMISIGWKEAVAELRRRGFIALRLEDGYPEWKAVCR